MPVSRSSAYAVHAAPPPCSADPGVCHVSAPDLGAGRDEVERPRKRAVGDIERHHPALDAPVAAGLRDVDEVVPHGRRGAHAFADPPVGDLAHPQRRAGLGIERVQEAVLRAADHSAAGDRDALVRRVHLWPLRDVLVRPELLARRRIDRVRAEVRRDVQHAVVHDGPGRERSELAQLEDAHYAELRRVAVSLIRSSVDQRSAR